MPFRRLQHGLPRPNPLPPPHQRGTPSRYYTAGRSIRGPCDQNSPPEAEFPQATDIEPRSAPTLRPISRDEQQPTDHNMPLTTQSTTPASTHETNAISNTPANPTNPPTTTPCQKFSTEAETTSNKGKPALVKSSSTEGHRKCMIKLETTFGPQQILEETQPKQCLFNSA